MNEPGVGPKAPVTGSALPDDELLSSYEGFFDSNERALRGLAYLRVGDLEEARDLAQETLTRAWENWERLSRYENPAAWARLVLNNLVTSRWRKFGRVRGFPRSPDVAGSVKADDEHLDLLAALRRLPRKYQVALCLRYYADLEYSEIAAEMNVGSENTVRSWVARGTAILRRELAVDSATDPEEE